MLRRLIFIFILSQTLTFGLQKVKYSAVIFRHGDRMPIDCYPNDPYKNESCWPEPFGQLTNTGKKQHFRLGKYLRQRYAHLLSEFYDPKELFVQSTDVDRTLMSAEANLAGLFLPIGKDIWNEQIPWQPIPVHTTKEKDDEVIAMKKHCQRYDTEMDKYVASPPYLSKLNKYKGFMEYLTKNTGMEVNDFTAIMEIYSCLSIEALYNFTLPEWTKTAFPEPLAKAAGISFSISAATPLLARLKIGPLVQQIVHKMSEVVKGKSGVRLMMYSGHDFTVGTLLTALGVFDNVCPVYTSTVFIELIHDNGVDEDSGDEKRPLPDHVYTASEWYVQLLYRNTIDVMDPVPLPIPGCGELCPFDKFLQIYENLITVDWQRDCDVDVSPTKRPASYQRLLIMALVVPLVIGLVFIIRKFITKRSESKMSPQRDAVETISSEE